MSGWGHDGSGACRSQAEAWHRVSRPGHAEWVPGFSLAPTRALLLLTAIAAPRLAARDGQRSRLLHEKPSRYSARHSGHWIRAKPFSKRRQPRYRHSCPSTRPCQKPYRHSKRPSYCPLTSSKWDSTSRYRGVARGFLARYGAAQIGTTVTLDAYCRADRCHQHARETASGQTGPPDEKLTARSFSCRLWTVRGLAYPTIEPPKSKTARDPDACPDRIDPLQPSCYIDCTCCAFWRCETKT